MHFLLHAAALRSVGKPQDNGREGCPVLNCMPAKGQSCHPVHMSIPGDYAVEEE